MTSAPARCPRSEMPARGYAGTGDLDEEVRDCNGAVNAAPAIHPQAVKPASRGQTLGPFTAGTYNGPDYFTPSSRAEPPVHRPEQHWLRSNSNPATVSAAS